MEDSLRLVVMINGFALGSVQYGAGLIIGRRGKQVYVLTAYHVLHDDKKQPIMAPTATLWSAPKEASLGAFELQIFASDEKRDLAIATFSLPSEHTLSNLSFYALADNLDLADPPPLYLVGQARGLAWSYSTNGNTLRQALFPTKITFRSNDVKRGSSGGGLFTSDWELIGMVLQTSSSDALSESEAVPIRTALEWAEKQKVPIELKPHVAIYDFFSIPETVAADGEATLHWRASPSASCKIDPGVGRVEKPKAFKRIDVGRENKLYTLSCTAPDYPTPIIRQWLVEVTQPPIVTLEALNALDAGLGTGDIPNERVSLTRILLRWKAENARRCTIEGEDVPAEGQMVVETDSSRIYSITCYNRGLSGSADAYAQVRESGMKRQYVWKGRSGPVAMDALPHGPGGARLALTIPSLPAMGGVIGEEVVFYPKDGSIKWRTQVISLGNNRKVGIHEGMRTVAELYEAAEREQLLLREAEDREVKARSSLQAAINQRGVDPQQVEDALINLRKALIHLKMARASRRGPDFRETLLLAERNVKSEEATLANLGIPLELATNRLKAEQDLADQRRNTPHLELEEAIRAASRRALSTQLRGVPELEPYTMEFGPRGFALTRFTPPYSTGLMDSKEYMPALLLYTRDHRLAVFEGGNNRMYFTPSPEVDNQYVKEERDEEGFQIYRGRTLSGDRVQGRRAYYPRALRRDGIPEASPRVPVNAHRTLYSIGGFQNLPHDMLCFFGGGPDQPAQKCFKIQWSGQDVKSIADDTGPVEKLEWLLQFAREQRAKANSSSQAVNAEEAH